MKKALSKFYHLNRMGRIEGPPLAGILLLAGAAFVGLPISWPVIIAAFCMTVFCMNYVYLVNGVTDVKEDAINSPERPLAKGVISIKAAKIYTQILFGITVVYPFFIHDTWTERIIIWIILLMGYFYSVPPVRFKRSPPLATIYLVVNFNLPIILGYMMASSSTALPPFIVSTIFLFLANMPLKDYGDRIGDEKAGVNNWVQIAGSPKNLLLLSSILSIAGSILCFFILPQELSYRSFFVLLPLLPAVNILFHQLLRLNMDNMFTHGVRSLIIFGMLYIASVYIIA